MNDYSNFSIACKSYLTGQRKIPTEVLDELEKKELIHYHKDHIAFLMRDLEGNQVGIQERFIIPQEIDGKLLKSKTKAGSHLGYFYDVLDFNQSVIIVEGECDFLSAYTLPNIIGLQGVANLKKLIEGLQGKGVEEIFVLTDNDPASDASIQRVLSLGKDSLGNIYDARSALQGEKDLNDYLKAKGPLRYEQIRSNAKSLRDFLVLHESFIEQGSGGKTSLKHDNFSEYLITKFSYECANRNIFSYEDGIRNIVDPDKVKYTIKQELSLLNLPKITKRDIEEVFDLIRIGSYNESLSKKLLEVNTKDINLYDCIYDVHSGEKRPYLPSEYKLHRLQYHSSLLESNNSPRLFLKFLEEIFEGYRQKAEIIEFLREYIGHLFLPITKFELGLYFRGRACNGKSTLIHVLEYLLGENNVSYLGLNKVYKAEKVSALFSKLANFDDEVSLSANIDDDNLKAIISGNKIEGRYLYKDSFFFRPYSRIIASSNHIGKVRSFSDNGAFRRFIFINLKQSFLGRKDVDLKEKLIQEVNEIFSRSIQSLPNLLKRNAFVVPSELTDQTTEAFKQQDTILLFLEECLEEGSGLQILNKVLYPMYRQFCKDNGETIETQKALSMRLLSFGYKKIEGNARGFKGIGIKTCKPTRELADITDITDVF